MSEQPEIEPERDKSSTTRKILVGVLGTIGIAIAAIFGLAFGYGAVQGVVGESSTVGGLYAIAGAVFVAPFSYALFDRLLTWVS